MIPEPLSKEKQKEKQKRSKKVERRVWRMREYLHKSAEARSMRICTVFLIAAFLLFLPAGAHAQEVVKLKWSYNTGGSVKSMAITPDGSYIAAGSWDYKLYLFSRDGKLLWSYRTGGVLVASVAITPDGSYIAVGSEDNKTYLFSRDGKLLWSYRTGGVPSVAISADGSYIAAGSDKLYLFSRDGKLLWSYETDGGVESVAITPDGSYIAAGSHNHKLYLFSRDGKLLWSYEAGSYVLSVAITSDGSYIAAGSLNNKMLYLFSRDGKLLWSYKTDSPVWSVAITPDGSYIAAGSLDGEVYFFSKDGKLLWSYKTGDWIPSVAISADGSYIAAGSEVRSELYLFSRDGKLLWSYETDGGVESVAITPDGSYIAAGSGWGKVYLFSRELVAETPVSGAEKSSAPLSITSSSAMTLIYSNDFSSKINVNGLEAYTEKGGSVTIENGWLKLTKNGRSNVAIYQSSVPLPDNFMIRTRVRYYTSGWYQEQWTPLIGLSLNKPSENICTGRCSENDLRSVTTYNYAGNVGGRIVANDGTRWYYWDGNEWTTTEYKGWGSDYVVELYHVNNKVKYKLYDPNSGKLVTETTWFRVPSGKKYYFAGIPNNGWAERPNVFWIDYVEIYALDSIELESPRPTISLSNSGGGTWKYSKTILIKNDGNPLKDYQLLVNIRPNDFPQEAKEDGSDIRFSDADGNELPYWIEEWDYYNKRARVWVKVPYIPSGTSKIFMYYGNPRAESSSDGDAVFEFFDDFDDGYFDTNKWRISGYKGGGVVTEKNGVCVVDATTGHTNVFSKMELSGSRYYLELKLRAISGFYGAGNFGASFGVRKDDSKYWVGYYTDGSFRFYHTYFGKATLLKMTSYSPGREWQRIKMLFDHNTKKVWIDNSLKLEIRDSEETTMKGVGFHAGKPTIIEVDWIFVRKYADPEPVPVFLSEGVSLSGVSSSGSSTESSSRIVSEKTSSSGEESSTGSFRSKSTISPTDKPKRGINFKFIVIGVIAAVGFAILFRRKPSEQKQEDVEKPATQQVEAQPKQKPAGEAESQSGAAKPEVDFQKLKELNSLINELKELVAKAEQLGVEAPSIEPVESLAEGGEYEKAIQEAKRLRQEITRLIESSRPEIKVEFETSRFRLNVGTRTKLHLRNSGRAIARNIELELSEDESLRDAVEFRILSLPEELPPGEAQPAEVWFTLTREGDLPLIFHLKYKDALGREYEHRQEVWVTVSSALEAPTPQPTPQPAPHTPQDFTPKPTTPKTFPAELAEAYSEPEFIGRGGFARVFRAKRKSDGREVAIKLPLTLDAATGKSFIKELQNWTRLKHANIVAIYDYNILPIPYFEMELCDCSLADIAKPMDVKEAAYIIFNVADGLRCAHGLGIIHRDLKPQNIMLRQGVPKISDWGLSKVMAESRTSLASFTPYYAAPEQISGGAKDHRIDIWQLGVIFYELVTGELPFKGESLMEIATAITTKQPKPPSQINPDAKEVEHIIMKCLEKKPEDRYQSVTELQWELAMYLGMSVKESLSHSLSVKDFSRSAYYCGELLVVNLKLGDGAGAYKYASDLLEYCKGEVEKEMKALAEQIKARLEERLEIPQELIEKAEILVHKLRLGFERV